MDKNLYRKPDDFKCKFTAKVQNNRAHLFTPLFLTILVTMTLLYYIWNYNIFMVMLGSVILLIFIPITVIAKKVWNDSTLIEISEEGIWLPLYNLYVPKSNIISTETTYSFLHRGFITYRPRSVALNIIIDKSDRIKMPCNGCFTSNKKKSSNQYIARIVIPYTVGNSEDIGLDKKRVELIQALNRLS